MKSLNILGFNFLDLNYNEIISLLHEKISKRETFTFLNVNSHILIEAERNPRLKENLENLSAIFADGVGVYWASKFLYKDFKFKERLTGTDLYYKILSYAQKYDRKVFFFGGGEKAAEMLEQNIKKMYPNLKISGILQRETNFSDLTVAKIRSSNSDILFVGLGSPYQEDWLAKYSKQVNIPVQVAMGSGIEFLSGNYKRAPEFFQNIGLEWFYRFLNEPARLWKRYFIGNPKFILKIIFQKLNT
ncbi:MAG: WecB/TagA/CpsF family glycosyltransferase [Bacteroidetes bacterium]|nr:WecB/TagA/CpsF family glycosyltransferase [Bacteroidota bacterium]